MDNVEFFLIMYWVCSVRLMSERAAHIWQFILFVCTAFFMIAEYV